MDLLDYNGVNLKGLGRKNVILGKNGCGKSYLLRLMEKAARTKPEIGALKYLSPERGGALQYDPGVDNQITRNTSHLSNSRAQNQATQFRQESAAQFRSLEIAILRQIEKDAQIRADPTVTFDTTVEKINGLLDRIQLIRSGSSFTIQNRTNGEQVQPNELSSGESELISLGIECLVFERECQPGKSNLLFMDEPDVHLHPDLQARLAKFIDDLTSGGNLTLIIATHSTALLGAMSEDFEHTYLAFMRYGDLDLTFARPSEAHRKILPVFGAHPLSNVFNQAPALLVEGEDDERLWQQVVRSSAGGIKVYPCSVNGIDQLSNFEKEVARILDAIYDTATAFSVRDRDTDPGELNNIGPVSRMRLACREAENLLLTKEVLASVGTDWTTLESRIKNWLENNVEHPHYSAMKSFADSGFNRKTAELKDIRNDLLGLMDTNKPWEVVVGQAIASLDGQIIDSESLPNFLGSAVCERILHLQPM